MPQNEDVDMSGVASAAAVAVTGVSAAANAAQQAADGSANVAQPNGSNGQPVVRRPMKPSWTQTPRILVVEDDVVYRQLSSKFLEKFGCIVETVENAQQGIERMNTAKFDLVLMDIFFGPSMDGRKATSLIRQFDMYTPIISMTSNVQTKDVDSYLQSGMNDVLAKPFTKHGLFCILDKHLIHLKALQMSGEVPRTIGVPPLSDQGVVDALTTNAAQWEAGNGAELGNPLAGSGWSDETYQLVLQQFLQTGALPDSTALLANGFSATAIPGATASAAAAAIQAGNLNAANGIGTNVLFSSLGMKRPIEEIEEWEENANKRQQQGAPAGTITEMA